MPEFNLQKAADMIKQDPSFALGVLVGAQHPDLAAALEADLEEAGVAAEVSGYLNPQPIPPGRNRIQAGPMPFGGEWSTLEFPRIDRSYFYE